MNFLHSYVMYHALRTCSARIDAKYFMRMPYDQIIYEHRIYPAEYVSPIAQVRPAHATYIRR